MRSYNPVRKGHSGQIRKAVQLLLQAKRPYIYTGGGVILGEASAELRELVNLLGYPCTNTLMGLGAFPASDPKFLGMLGMHGTYEANMTMQNCDVLLAVGARFDDRVIGNPKHFAQVERKIIHVDIDPSSISKRVRVDIPIVGDVKDVLQELIHQLKEAQAKPDSSAINAWWSQINEWRRRECLSYKSSSEVIKPQMVVETLWNLTKDRDTYITSDVGQHQMWAAQFYRFDEPRRWINSGGLGTMGVGLPYAMGIKLAKPESDWQELDYGKRYSHSYMEALPDFVKLAEAYGHVGLLVEKPSDVEGPHGLPGHPHRPDRERLAHGPGGQGHFGNAAGVRRPLSREVRPGPLRYRARLMVGPSGTETRNPGISSHFIE
ncbi:unnamed protein product [Victoria cruziana]